MGSILDGGAVDPGLVEFVMDRSAGNPLFMEELTRTLLANGAIRLASGKYTLDTGAERVRVPENIHGRSMRFLVEGRVVPWRDHAFCQRADHVRMLRTERYKFVHLARQRGVALYDLKNDPHEDRNLATEVGRARKTLREMHARLLEIMARNGDPARDQFAKLPWDNRPKRPSSSNKA